VSRILAVTGLRAEAQIAESAGLVAVCAGGVPERTEAALEAALAAGGGAEGVAALISFGLAGGLAPGLRPGTILVADRVLTATSRHDVPPFWRRLFLDARIGIEAPVYGADEILARAGDKKALHDRSGAAAVDLESHIVARTAERRRLPWLVLRAIADPAECDLPPAALIPLCCDGTPDLRRILGSAAASPGQVPGLLRLAAQTRTALEALRGCVRTLRGLSRMTAEQAG
jgi:adenosylhomocysteine nucleosidase